MRKKIMVYWDVDSEVPDQDQVQWVNVPSLEAEYEANRMYYRHELKYAK